jgi:hypothetical protein
MERLHQLTKVIPFLLFLGGLQAAIAADYCSLVVRVLSPDRRRPLEVLISVREGSGRVIEKETTSEDVRFCDLGITPVTVRVGGDTCNQTVVRDVPLTWQEQYVLTITYDPEPCMPERPPAPVPTCQELFRVADTAGNWLEKASIRFQQPHLSPRETDGSGRALVVMKDGDHADGTVSSSGYITKPFSLSCSRTEPVHEEMIKLVKSSGH